MAPAGFETLIQASERQQTHDLERAATGTGSHLTIYLNQQLQNREQIINHRKKNYVSNEIFNQQVKKAKSLKINYSIQ
jgi:hypothetical protein